MVSSLAWNGLTVIDIDLTAEELADGAVHKYDLLTEQGSASLIVFSDGREDLTNNQGAFDALANGDILFIEFDYVVSDGINFGAATQTIKINGVNDAPMDGDESGDDNEIYRLGENESRFIPLEFGKLENFFDPEGDEGVVIDLADPMMDDID